MPRFNITLKTRKIRKQRQRAHLNIKKAREDNTENKKPRRKSQPIRPAISPESGLYH